ncbi:PhzF family phenazine biosynthesis protein [Nonomuraea dietziae]|uniref:Putative PhzF superfamily epimerase YddE/YHI9 n=1 Tax=Nonomuraea dietziae TaxID=65515 RepID=A0A7W5V9B2_9ACTN|nr:PhzF family phenazine biosynthesis protein [Nonomuraea dietziae]MBB3727440.1 putative PhzF superfamily epimerase YddE/YHI9 [Nonomuraea dietziae]
MPQTACLVTGSAFVDVDDPGSGLGNPFAVVLGDDVPAWDLERRRTVARRSGAPETVFVNALRGSQLEITVLTPTGQELGACAHGFIGAVHTLAATGALASGDEVEIRTSATAAAVASVRPGDVVMLRFVSRPPRPADDLDPALTGIFPLPVRRPGSTLEILSVGSPKLTVEVTPETFALLRTQLHLLDFDNLLHLQRTAEINGVHLFCRDPQTLLPAQSIQVNAYLGEDLMIDRATGVSNAAQVSADPYVRPGQQVQIAQYSRQGRTAILSIIKGHHGEVQVGGAATLTSRRPADDGAAPTHQS